MRLKMVEKSQEVTDYIQHYPIEIQERLEKIRELIHQEAPEAVEKMSYGIPTFVLKKPLVHFAAYQKHIGFYPTSSGIRAFSDQLQKFKTSKGTIQLPNSQPLPLELIRQIVQYRIKENQALS